jgi:hypothetical protein
MKTNLHFLSYLAHFFLEGEMFQTKFVEKIKTHILCLVNIFENLAIYEIMWRNNVERGRQYDARALHSGYLRLQIHKLRLCNTYCFSTATMVARTRLNVML